MVKTLDPRNESKLQYGDVSSLLISQVIVLSDQNRNIILFHFR